MVRHDSSCKWVGFVWGITCGALAACAGEDTPPLDADARRALYEIHVQGKTSSNPGQGGTSAVAGGPMNESPGTGGSRDQPDDDDDPGGGGPMASSDAGTVGGGGGTVCNGFPILQMSCGNGAFCHGSGSTVSAFAASASAAEAFVGERAEGADCSASTALIFDPDDPAASLVITKLTADPPCGVGMPYGQGGTMPPADVECLEEWIGSL